MTITKGMNLLDADHVARHVPWNRLRKDGDDNVLGILPTAFELRLDEPSLSVNWLEYYAGDRNAQLCEVVKAIRRNREIGKKSAFGIGNVGTIKSICRDHGATVRIVFSPSRAIPEHSEIRYIPKDDLALLAAVAEDAFGDLVPAANII